MGRQGQAPRHRRRGGSGRGIIPPARRLVAPGPGAGPSSPSSTGPGDGTDPSGRAGDGRHGIEGLEGTTLQYELWSRSRIRVRGAPAVRQSCHVYSDFSQIDETLEVVRRLARL